MKKANVGGQAVIEGVMMKNEDQYAVAVRKPNQEIVIDQKTYVSLGKRYKILGVPFVRGIVAFGESMVLGMKILSFSAEFFEVEDEKESKMDTWINKTFKDKANSIIIGISMILAMLMAIGLFVLLPLFITELIKPMIPNEHLVNLSDGIIRIIVFLMYIILISKMKDIQRVFQYHGAEHKTINCYEAGLDLTVENAMKQTRLHKRCGTSFLMYVVIISVFVMTIVNAQTVLMRFVARILLLPVIAGVSYEVLKFIGKSDSKILGVFAKPGLMLQRITTQEPDASQLEVAIASLKCVLHTEEENETNTSIA
ncbi:MAG: DUF1385 domain-containing protein [Vallitaleaceae bacterium]|nr:DUF1385 domain-containing protein [Vallitaleaceae bacterium]